MALTTRQKKQGAVVTAAVGALTLGGVAVSTLGPSSVPANSKPISAAAVPGPGAAPSSPGPSSTTITITAKADSTKAGDDTVFTVSGEVKGMQPGAKIRLQRQQTPTSAKASPVWSTLAYTTFTDSGNKFSFPVKMETSGSYTLRVLHPQDREGPKTAYSSPFTVTVSAAASGKKG